MAKRGPGKFSSDLDAAIYDLSLDGTDEECGSVQDVGFWAGLLRDGKSIADALADDTALSDADLRKVSNCAGVIVGEHEDGSVEVGYYATKRDLDHDWEIYVDDAEMLDAELEADDISRGGGGDEEYDSDYADE